MYGLLLSPIIGVGATGGYDVPNLNHSVFNYHALGELMGDLFWQAATVQLRLPNDSIDIATFDKRFAEMNASNGAINSNNVFSEFGNIVMRNANSHENGIIDIRKSKSWVSKKSKAAQIDNVYPPQIIPFCVLSDHAEDTNWWFMHALEAINDVPLQWINLAGAFSGKPPVTKANQGVLPTNILSRLNEMFEIEFEPKATLIKMASHAR